MSILYKNKYNLRNFLTYLRILQVNYGKLAMCIAFRGLNKTLLTMHLSVLETTIRATSRALQYWNIAFKRP